MQDTHSRWRWPGIMAVLAVAGALAALVFARGDVAAGAQHQPAATPQTVQQQTDDTQARRGHDCPEHGGDGGGGGAAPQQQAPSTQAPGTEL